MNKTLEEYFEVLENEISKYNPNFDKNLFLKAKNIILKYFDDKKREAFNLSK